MSLLIKGIKIPKNCGECHLKYDIGCVTYVGFHHQDTARARKCPLIELPEKHGRLIDENDVINAIHDRLHELQTHKEFNKKHGDIDLLGVLPYIAKIKSVIEAE